MYFSEFNLDKSHQKLKSIKLFKEIDILHDD